MATANASPSNNGARPPNSPDQTPQITECKQLTDIGLCVLVCDCKVQDLLEWMFAHDFSKKSGWRESLTEQLLKQLPTYMKGEGDREKLTQKLRIDDLDRMEANELKCHLKYTMRLSLYELQCALQALSGDEYQLDNVKANSLRETRNNVVHRNYKFLGERERVDFLATYENFINEFDFEKYFGSPHAEIKEKSSQLSRNYEDLVKMLSEYNDIQKKLEEEKAECKERYNQLEKQCKTLEVERDQLKERVEKMEKQLEKEIADKSLLEWNCADQQQRNSEKDKEIDSIHKTLEEERNQQREQAEKRQKAFNELEEQCRALEAHFNREVEAKRLLERDLAETTKQHSDKDKKIDQIHKKLEEERNQWKEQVEKRREAHNRLDEDYKTLEAQLNREVEAKRLLKVDLAEMKRQHLDKDREIAELMREQAEVTEKLRKINEGLLREKEELEKKELIISKLDQEMERLKYQARKDDSYITKLEDDNDGLKDQLSRCRCNMNIHKTLEKERAECKEPFNQLEKECKTLEEKQLKEKVKTLEEQLEDGIADKSLLKQDLAETRQQHSEKDKDIDKPLQPQAQTLQSTEWEQLTDTGLCMLVCDSKVKDLLENMLAHALLKMSDEEVALMAEKLPKHMKADARKRLREKLKKTGLGRMNEEELKDHISKTMGLYQLQCVVEALDEDKDGLVEKLRNERNYIVSKNYKFEDENERETFLATYDEFIAKFDFKKYFGSSHAETRREECLQLSRKHEELMKMLSEYRDQTDAQVQTTDRVDRRHTF